MNRLWLPGLALTLALGLRLRPYAPALYHLEAGGRALEAALAYEEIGRRLAGAAYGELTTPGGR